MWGAVCVFRAVWRKLVKKVQVGSNVQAYGVKWEWRAVIVQVRATYE